MKVRCVTQVDEHTGSRLEKSSWLTVGKVYHVLEISIDQRGTIKFRLVGDDEKTPALHLWTQFSLASNVIPSCWIVDLRPEVLFSLRPRTWAGRGFWERYFDGDSLAREQFEEARRAIIAEDP
jgi:hypothetical protein